MRAIAGILAKPRAVTTRRVLLFIVRAFAILSMSFAAAFGVLAAMTSPTAHYDPHSFAVGAAAPIARQVLDYFLLGKLPPQAAAEDDGSDDGD